MKAAMYADWINFREQMRTVVILVAFCIVYALSVGMPVMFSTMLVVISWLFPNAAFNAGLTSGWDRLSLCLPVSRRDVVAGRFLLALAVNAVLFVLALGLAALLGVLPIGDSTVIEGAAAALAGETVALILLGTEMAAAFKWGLQKASYIAVGFFCLIMLIPISVFTFGALEIDTPRVSAFMTWLLGLEEHAFLLLLLGCALAGLAVYALCYLISVRVYRKKEF